MTVQDLTMFDPPALGLPADSWDELEADAKTNLPKCEECDHRLRSPESQEAGIGPCCAAKIGRAVVARRKARRAEAA